jgi:uncharacterized protein YcbK (DUF882 family)
LSRLWAADPAQSLSAGGAGRPGDLAVSLIVQKQSGTNTVAVVERVKHRLEEIRDILPDDIDVQIIRDQSRFIENSIHEVQTHLLLAAVLVSLTILLFMRDWRTGSTKKMDGRTIDIMAASHRLLDVNEPYMLLSGYRSPQTNAMLRSRSGGVARNSLHLMGQAADLRLKSRSVNQMARAAQACASGGVGRYSRSNFVHMDCGTVRTWGG